MYRIIQSFVLNLQTVFKSLYKATAQQIKNQVKQNNMTYPFIAIGLTAVFIVYILYLLLIKKDIKKFKAVLLPGLVFIAIWAIIYCAWLK